MGQINDRRDARISAAVVDYEAAICAESNEAGMQQIANGILTQVTTMETRYDPFGWTNGTVGHLGWEITVPSTGLWEIQARVLWGGFAGEYLFQVPRPSGGRILAASGESTTGSVRMGHLGKKIETLTQGWVIKLEVSFQAPAGPPTPIGVVISAQLGIQKVVKYP